MAKITLGNRPKNFKQTVTFLLLDGSEASVDVIFTYRTKTEFGKFMDGVREAATARSSAKGIDEASPAKVAWAEIHELGVEANADHLVGMVEGWNLDSPPTRESFQQLADELPAAANAIFEAYRKAIVEGRLGN